MAKTFVLNDENKVNSYGFKILNKGINLERFKANPVMLSNHWNSTDNVIGRWENIRIEGSQLKADAVFDDNDEDAKKIASKVDGGFLKGASMGIRFSHEFMEEKPDGSYVLAESELYEASIVAVPSNANAVKLYSGSGELLDEVEIKLSLDELKGVKSLKSNNNMSKILLSDATIGILGAFGLKDAESALEVDTAVAKLKAELDAEKVAHSLEKTQREALEARIREGEKAQLNALLDQAVTDGQILANQKETFAALGYEQAKTIIGGLPKKVSLAGQVGNSAGADGGVDPKTAEEFFKLSVVQQLAFKDANPAAYKALFA